NVSGAQRVWVAVYDKEDEQKLRLRLGLFEEATQQTGHHWFALNLTDAFANWMCSPENTSYAESYFEAPDLLDDAVLADFKQTAAELDTLRYELTNFVCDGQYADGLVRILSTYLGHLDKSEQPGVWVSGFFGSGKSHLVKMAQHLWTDFEFPDGARARGLPKN